MKIEDIQELMRSFEQSGISKMEIKEKEFSLKLEKPEFVSESDYVQQHMVPTIQNIQPIEDVISDSEEEQEGTWIQAPLVGTFYAARSQDSKPFIEIGQRVKKGDVLCIIEAMKVMNELHAPCDGIVRSILVTNASMVEFDQKLIRIGEAI